MPLLDDDMETLKTGSFGFTGTRIENLGFNASEYTLATILVDVTGSEAGFETETREMVVMAVDACKRSDRAENMMVRVVLFSSRFPKGISEVHGFKLLADINTDDYPQLVMGGNTPLYDACYSVVAAMNAYAKELLEHDYTSNGVTFIITDGGESPRASTMGIGDVRKEIEKSVTGEIMQSHVTVLIGIDTGFNATATLQAFQADAGITEFRDAGQASKGTLAKLAQFVSNSVSSVSQSLATGGPSQIAATI